MKISETAEWLRENINTMVDWLDNRTSTKASDLKDLIQLFIELEEDITTEDANAARIHKISTLIHAAERYAKEIEADINDAVSDLLRILSKSEELEQYFSTQAENGGD